MSGAEMAFLSFRALLRASFGLQFSKIAGEKMGKRCTNIW